VVTPLQFIKADLPIDFTEFGISKVVTPLQFIKADLPIDFTEFGISKVVKLPQ
jgi:hypothetical protein